MARATKDPTKRIYKGPGAQIGALAWSDDNRWIAAADWKGAVTLWSLDDPAPRWSTMIGSTRTVSVGFDSDRVVATLTNGTVAALALDDGRLLHQASGLPTCNGFNILHAHGGHVLFCGSSTKTPWATVAVEREQFEVVWQRERVTIVGVEDGLAYIRDRITRGPEEWLLSAVDVTTGSTRWDRSTGAFWACAVHPAAGVVALSDSSSIRFGRIEDGTAISQVIPIGRMEIADFKFSPDGHWLAVSKYPTVTFVEVATGLVVQSSTKHTKTVSCVAWSKDGSMVLSGGWDRVVRVHAAPHSA
jgi:WD40 repeat protein